MGWVNYTTPRPLCSREREPVPLVQMTEWAPGSFWMGADGTTSVLFLLAICQQICMTYHCCVYSEKHLMMDRGTVRNM